MTILDIERLLSEIKEIAECQRQAILNQDMDRLFCLQDKRRDIMEMIQKFDIFKKENNKKDEIISPDKESFSPAIKKLIEEIIRIDEDIKSMIKRDMNTVINSMAVLGQVKKSFLGNRGKQNQAVSINI